MTTLTVAERQSNPPQPTTLTEIFHDLFAPKPGRHVKLVKVTPDGSRLNKEGKTLHESPKLTDYEAHLSNPDLNALKTIGVLPGSLAGASLVSWLAMDLDRAALSNPQDKEKMQTLLDTLESFDIYPYVTTGTTGKGMHIYVFLDEPVSQSVAHAALLKMRTMASDAGLGPAELMPSNKNDLGKAIFLPYRGAACGGYGANPLLNPHDWQPISLCDTSATIKRSSLTQLMQVPDHISKPEVYKTVEYNLSPTTTHEDVWRSELERVSLHWRPGKRQHLSLGLAAFGIYCGIDHDVIIQDILALAEVQSDPEIQARREAIHMTLTKGRKNQPISYRHWFDKADVEPPRLNQPPHDVLRRLAIFKTILEKHAWKGVAGYTDRAVCQALLNVAKKHGRPHPLGVEVSISVRDLALKANVSARSITTSLGRLKRSQLVYRGSNSMNTSAGSLLLITEHAALPHSHIGNALLEDCGNLATNARWGAGRLGKSKAMFLEALVALGGSARLKEIAAKMDKKANGLYRTSKALATLGLITKSNKKLCLVPDYEERFKAVLRGDGSERARARDKDYYERERQGYWKKLKEKALHAQRKLTPPTT